MIKEIYEKIFGTTSEHVVKKYWPVVDKIEALEPEIEKLSDKELTGKTQEFKDRLAKGETLDDIMIEAFAVVREAARRTIGKRHYRVQLLGGILLHKGVIVEMKTGEGKTLTATLPSYLNALEGKGVHVVTVNDYLAKRDSEWMGKIHRFLGLSVGCNINGMKLDEKKEAYNCDITYGTSNEFGFDYLRDNMAIYKDGVVQRDLHYTIIDEVDSILIDEARTPLIISGKSDKATELYTLADRFVKGLTLGRVITPQDKMSMIMAKEVEEEGDYIVDEKQHQVALTAEGISKAERFFNLENYADAENLELQHHIQIALKANNLMHLEKDYIIKDGKIIIVDEFTGRLMPGRRYSDGLHQAIEAKEKVEVNSESKTMATITLQSYFNKYNKKAGMTGTALTEEDEFREIYKVEVVELPANKPVIRQDLPDSVYKNKKGKLNAIVNAIMEANKVGQPVLVGTITIDASEEISRALKAKGIKHQVLNAKYHEKEAEIVAQAGRFGAVTIATNMAGRGTDILLGGNSEYMAKQEMKRLGVDEELISQADTYYETDDENIIAARKQFKELDDKFSLETNAEKEKVLAVGGLKIIGTERHESRRIDNQLRGRSGRQGDPGESRFYISLEDDLMRLFGSERMLTMLSAINMPEDMAIEHGMLSNTIRMAQKKVEERNFDTRKRLLEYDNVLNEQRKVIYDQRNTVLNGSDVKDSVVAMVEETATNLVNKYFRLKEEYDVEGFLEEIKATLPYDLKLDYENMKADEIEEKVIDYVDKMYDEKEKELTPQIMRDAERMVLLRAVDSKWIDHIDAMDEMKQWIVLQGYAQRDPLIEYQATGNDMFNEMIEDIKNETARGIFTVRTFQNMERKQVMKNISENHGEEKVVKQRVSKDKLIGRNDPCPCGSGLKYKNCCGK
ncbi:MAG: preprotein translocase subunit SecA [Clostridia bacterium]|nr:preprotein translocase subunit SecA [Clostridia bacterium]